ncbi:hypothetical protein B0J13DRAFT_270664 [Dactylonectria estremocensis]|uniref:Uncharacterized protein n=1 Tax=Dactylonectria estremocensis TaxID=1079267 RepID=A0A9P9D3K4_9HYPO|nr:hypothetical protein B0J13DRAFT_270664 [Dactylonectria estremocensis]
MAVYYNLKFITMSLTNSVSTALAIAFGLSAVANLSTSVKAILQHLNPQRNHRETSFVSVVPPSLSTRHPRTFTAVVITHCVIATGSSLTFAILLQEYGDPWSTYLSSSIIVSSMIREPALWLSEQSQRQAGTLFFRMFLEPTTFSCALYRSLKSYGQRVSYGSLALTCYHGSCK